MRCAAAAKRDGDAPGGDGAWRAASQPAGYRDPAKIRPLEAVLAHRDQHRIGAEAVHGKCLHRADPVAVRTTSALRDRLVLMDDFRLAAVFRLDAQQAKAVDFALA